MFVFFLSRSVEPSHGAKGGCFVSLGQVDSPGRHFYSLIMTVGCLSPPVNGWEQHYLTPLMARIETI